MKIKLKELIICIALPVSVGLLSALITRSGIEDFNSEVIKPSFSPPAFLFPIVWTVLYILMGISSYLVIVSDKEKTAAVLFYGLQLILNFYWSIIFFNLKAYQFAFIWLIVLLVSIIITAYLFYKISRPAAYLLIPYILWVTFAGYLNYSIYLLN